MLEGLGKALSGIPEAASRIPENIQRLPQSVADSAANVANSVSGVAKTLSDFVWRYVEGFAVMIVTSCLIPIIVILLFLWLANILLGINVSISRKPPAMPLKRDAVEAQD